MITIVDYDMGNIGSISNMIKKLGYKNIITSSPKEIDKANRLILPGVGSFDSGMKNLINLKLIEILNKKVLLDKTPILGICLGMQLMTNTSEEGSLDGFGWIDADTEKFVFEDLQIPHMGWNRIKQKKDSNIIPLLEDERRYYFVHSYYVECHNKEDILTTTTYGKDFVSSFQKDNILGVQFHPEKSHRFGMELLKNFIENSNA